MEYASAGCSGSSCSHIDDGSKDVFFRAVWVTQESPNSTGRGRPHPAGHGVLFNCGAGHITGAVINI
jgi:hypothetical protein